MAASCLRGSSTPAIPQTLHRFSPVPSNGICLKCDILWRTRKIFSNLTNTPWHAYMQVPPHALENISYFSRTFQIPYTPYAWLQTLILPSPKSVTDFFQPPTSPWYIISMFMSMIALHYTRVACVNYSRCIFTYIFLTNNKFDNFHQDPNSTKNLCQRGTYCTIHNKVIGWLMGVLVMYISLPESRTSKVFTTFESFCTGHQFISCQKWHSLIAILFRISTSSPQ